MTDPNSGPTEHYATIVDAFRGDPDVTYAADVPGGKRGFGSSALTVKGKIFAMLVNGRLVVKLPRPRVDALVGSGDGERFDPGHGRLMKEWLAVAPTSEERWLVLAREAKAFVTSRR